MAQKQKPWEERGWERGTSLEGGNQGFTYLARRSDDPPGQFNYVLKELRRQEDLTRRKRLHIEAASLRIVDSERVSRLVCTNADIFADVKVPLYVVTEHIKGTALDQLRPLPLDLKSACIIVSEVIETLKACHKLKVCHRDIKPCHVILRESSPSAPVLIDFGLAFNDVDESDEQLTALDQGVGNRFIIMPEQLYGIDKSDPRSDLTQCIGLLYYMLTGNAPGIIFDTNQRKPHEIRPLNSDRLDISESQSRKLKRIFDIGFSHSLDDRWQTHETLVDELSNLTSPDSPAISFSDRIELLMRSGKSRPENQLAEAAENALKNFTERFNDCVTVFNSKCGDLVELSFSSSGSGKGSKRSWTCSARKKYDGSKQHQFTILIERQGSEFVANTELREFAQGGFGPASSPPSTLASKRFGVMDPDVLRIGKEFIEESLEKVLETLLV